MNMTRANVVGNLLHPENWGKKKNPAATPSALADWGFIVGRDPSPLGETLVACTLSWQEVCILSLAKRGPGDGDAPVKPFVAMMKVLASLQGKPGAKLKFTARGFTRLSAITSYADITDEFCLGINDPDKTGEPALSNYRDIWLNALAESGLFIRNDDDYELIVSDIVMAFVSQVAKFGEKISPCPSKRINPDAYYAYMGTVETGLPEIFDLMDSNVVWSVFPHFWKTGTVHGIKTQVKVLQQIYYGAPGTGKSHKIDKLVDKQDIIRTTFHPESDYSTFVGSYKPTMCSSENQEILSLNELKEQLLLFKEKGGTYPCHKFAFKYFESLKFINKNDLLKILEECGFTQTMTAEIDKGKAIGEFAYKSTKNDIVYKFVPQAFVNAYVKAWTKYAERNNEKELKHQYLVIEEINRGNCAQIFGDLFQLLDRDERGFSKYSIEADTDLKSYLKKAFENISVSGDAQYALNSLNSNYSKQIFCGDILVLPPNLYIWASMNTSDQSLFPMDSAFKRRWDWEYVPIKDAGKGWKIEVGDTKVDW
jgi:hypothetical protein